MTDSPKKLRGPTISAVLDLFGVLGKMEPLPREYADRLRDEYLAEKKKRQRLEAERDALAVEVELFRKDVRRIVNWATSALSGADAWGVCVNEIKAIARALLEKDGGA